MNLKEELKDKNENLRMIKENEKLLRAEINLIKSQLESLKLKAEKWRYEYEMMDYTIKCNSLRTKYAEVVREEMDAYNEAVKLSINKDADETEEITK